MSENPNISEKKVSELSAEELQQLAKAAQQKEAEKRNADRASYEALREATVIELSKVAIELHKAISNFKEEAFGAMETQYQLLGEYSNRSKTANKGNFELKSNDGQFKIVYRNQENGTFDERSKEAEAHIIAFVEREFVDKPTHQELITKLLERKKGKLDIKLVQKLYAMEDKFDDQDWRDGIRLLKESWQPTETKSYITFYVQNEEGAMVHLPLNFSAV